MASLIRSAKSGNDWTDDDLTAYNITILSLNSDEFFLAPDPPLDHINPAILNSPLCDKNPTMSDAAAGYLGYLGLATRPTEGCFTIDFTAETLRLLGFNEHSAVVFSYFTIPLTICGEADHVAQADVCLLYTSALSLLVLIKSRTLTNGANAEAQVVAEAVAAFQFNNKQRRDHGLNYLDVMTIPCIIMDGTRPTFYLVPVTAELNNAVITGQYPATQTQVLRCVTTATHTSAGMEDPEYRKLALKRLSAFKTSAKNHWVHILEGLM